MSYLNLTWLKLRVEWIVFRVSCTILRNWLTGAKGTRWENVNLRTRMQDHPWRSPLVLRTVTKIQTGILVTGWFVFITTSLYILTYHLLIQGHE